MANLYYSYPSNRHGILRAVMSLEKCKVVLKEHSPKCTGDQFPLTTQNTGDDFAILQVFEAEASGEYVAGFYLFDVDIMQIEKAMQG